jgi:hypothetical protein
MALLVSPDGKSWIPAGPDAVWGFDTTLGRPVFRMPDELGWVDASGQTIASPVTGAANFSSSINSGLLAVI